MRRVPSGSGLGGGLPTADLFLERQLHMLDLLHLLGQLVKPAVVARHRHHLLLLLLQQQHLLLHHVHLHLDSVSIESGWLLRLVKLLRPGGGSR